MYKFSKMAFWQTFLNSSNFMRLIFHLDSEEHIFDRISRNTYPNWMGLVSLLYRSKILSYETKLIFFSFWSNFHHRLWKLIFNRISWNTYPNQMGIVSLWYISKILSYEFKLIFSVFGRIFIVCAWFLAIQPMFNKFESLRTIESHQDWE